MHRYIVKNCRTGYMMTVPSGEAKLYNNSLLYPYYSVFSGMSPVPLLPNSL